MVRIFFNPEAKTGPGTENTVTLLFGGLPKRPLLLGENHFSEMQNKGYEPKRLSNFWELLLAKILGVFNGMGLNDTTVCFEFPF